MYEEVRDKSTHYNIRLCYNVKHLTGECDNIISITGNGVY